MDDDFLDGPPMGEGAVATIPQGNQLAEYVQENMSPEMQTAVMLQGSGLFPNTGSVAGVFTVVQYGKEVGLKAVQALNNVAIINGKLSMSGASMLALGYANGVTAEFKQEDAQACTIVFNREGHIPYTSTFTIEDAEKAALGDRDKDGKLKPASVWYKYTKTMLKWRAVAQGMRMIAPDVLAGVYTKDEIVNIENHADESRNFGNGIVNHTSDPADEPEPSAQKDTPKEEAQVADKITEPQMKRLHALMNEKGVSPFREGFKMFLATFADSGIGAGGSAKDLTKDFSKTLIGDFDKYARTFFSDEKSRTYLIKEWDKGDRKSKAQVIAGMKTLVKGGESFPLEVNEDTSDVMIADWFQLMLTAIKNQETNRVADAGEAKGMTAEQVQETLSEIGMPAEVVDKADVPKAEEKKEAPKEQKKDEQKPLLDF